MVQSDFRFEYQAELIYPNSGKKERGKPWRIESRKEDKQEKEWKRIGKKAPKKIKSHIPLLSSRTQIYLNNFNQPIFLFPVGLQKEINMTQTTCKTPKTPAVLQFNYQ